MRAPGFDFEDLHSRVPLNSNFGVCVVLFCGQSENLKGSIRQACKFVCLNLLFMASAFYVIHQPAVIFWDWVVCRKACAPLVFEVVNGHRFAKPNSSMVFDINGPIYVIL